jgi:hypothetical protein
MSALPRILNVRCFALLFLTAGILSYSAIASAQKTTRKTTIGVKESAVDRIVVALFKANLKDPRLKKEWETRREDFQQVFALMLGEQSYLEVTTTPSEYELNEDKDMIKDEARETGVDGVLVGEYRGTTLELAVRSGATGRQLARYTIPVPPLSDRTERQFFTAAVQAVVLGFPYRGFVLATKDERAKLNLGKKQALQVGTKLEVFEFEGLRPSFSSPQRKIGTLRITKINPDSAIAVVTSNSEPIRPYNKVAFAKLATPGEIKAETRVHTGPWVTAGILYNYLDTQVSSDARTLQHRIYQLPLTPFITAGLGYSRFAANIAFGNASNTSNKVQFVVGDASYEVFPWKLGNKALITSLGAHYYSSKVTLNTPDQATQPVPYPLVSFTNYSGLLSEALSWVTSQQTKLFAEAKLLYPYFSTDAENGSSSAFGSFGFAGEAGLRVDVSKIFSIDGGLTGRFLRIALQTGDGISELQFGFFARVTARF